MKNFLLITEHPIERVTRVLIGIGLISIVFVGPKTGWGWLGLLPLITGFTGLCPLYTVLGISTLGKKATPVPAGRTLHQGLGLAGAAVMCASIAGAQADLAGHWEGRCTANGRDLTLTLDLAKNAKSVWVASMGVPSENATGLVVTDVAVNGASVTFVAVELMMAKFNLTLTPEATLKGTFTNPGASVPIEFKRTGEAHVDVMVPSPAVSKDLEGDWEGKLAAGPPQGFQILVRFKNQPDGTVEATFNNLTMGQGAVPINDVRQADRKVEFGLKVAHGTFQGTLNTDGTVLDGHLTHEGAPPMPLTLRKK